MSVKPKRTALGVLLQDDFNDNSLDRAKWVPLRIGGGNVYERNNRIEYVAYTHGDGGGIDSVPAINVENASIKVKLSSPPGPSVVSFITVRPSETAFTAHKSEGYTIGVWRDAGDQVMIYRNGSTVYTKGSIAALPDNIEIRIEGGVITFLEEGVEIYSEPYQPTTPTYNVRLTLWGVSWYLGASGTAWADDLVASGEVPAVAGHIGEVTYWIEGMPGWRNLEEYPTPAKVGDDIHLTVWWVNDGSYAVVGHVDAQLTSPKLYPYLPEAVLNQDRSALPNHGYAVQFAPVTLNEAGSWEFYGRLNLDDQTSVDWKKFTFNVGEVPEGIPTTITLSAPETVGVNEKFNVSGILYETESGVPIPNQPINHSYDGKSLGGSTTGVDGDYLKQVSIPESGAWTIKSEYPGTPGYAASKSVAGTMVAATPLEAAVKIAGPAAVGLALTIYSLKK